jgi:hypothetical protein
VIVSVVVEQMHQWACGQQQEWQVRNHVCAMLGDQEVRRDRDKAEKYVPRDTAQPIGWVRGLMIMLHTIAP